MSTGAARKPARDLGRGVIEVTAMRRTIGHLIRVAAVAFVALPVPLPTPTALPTALPIAVPSISVPAVVVAPPPSLAALITPGDPPAALPPPSQGAQPGTASGHAAGPAGTANPPAGNPPQGIVIPFTTIYVSSALDIALIGALVTLPLLFGIWMLLFGRTFLAARRAKEAQVRLLLAADLGLRPKDLLSMSTKALFNLREKSAFDELTGVLRRAAGISVAEREIARARRHNTPLSIAFVDLDGLKHANDRKGHAAGDALLRGLSHALKDGLRAEDAVLRYGGDEFVCVLPDTEVRGARAKLGAIQMGAARSGIRFSAGVAQLQRHDDVVALFARADRDLYDFKANRGEIVQLPPPDAKPRHKRRASA
jgi:diguanylate cyclase (GGDEF)-like protein